MLEEVELKPVVFMNGDDSTRRGADMVRQIVFPDFPFVECDTGVDARIATNDNCLDEAARLLGIHRAGIKISTASNDPRIVERGWKSASRVKDFKEGLRSLIQSVYLN